MDQLQGRGELIFQMLSDAMNSTMMGDSDAPMVLSCGGIYLGHHPNLPTNLRGWHQMLTLPHHHQTFAIRLRRPTPLKLFQQVLQKESLN
ncbi:MAG: hypothetical protein A3I75_00905 [Deltaproteobacteria bacterium RIFCSPLOWO2_02_FULL_50_16]|nr:MAG: hypothetical protein A3B79_02425 [Deltaproteobacteria bacterium RIFCSPHIGHO2_02_FULL_50_15]OGQ56383.1 MAG: hypothetical protein A3I75_00905 [Deltaproteobacteria bacterium RIFCSPLOWO2_02_FULL_50_16]OGQ67786.1 MAG: hypothetical protein A3F89_02150 [Deltaproteobacteria bacterium RIFCSPLOWO2_12_FULL_50_11]